MNWRFSALGWRLFPGALVSLTMAAATYLGALQPLEYLAYNALFQLRGESAWDERVVVIAIDEASLTQLGQFPFSRQNYVQVLEVLTEAEVNLVVFDVIWAEASPQDARLAQAIARHGRVLLPRAWDGTGLPLLPQAQFKDAALEWGHVVKREDADGISRQVLPDIQGIPTLSIATLQAYSLTTAAVKLPTANPLWVNWARRSRHIPSYSFVDVVQGKIARSVLRDKIVVIGFTAAGLDPLVTPFDRDPPSRGVYLHATLINNLLKDNLLQVPSAPWLIAILLVGGPGCSWLLTRWKLTQQLWLGLGVSGAWGGLGLFWFHQNYWIPVATPLLLTVGTTVAVIIADRLRMNQLLQQQVDRLWQTYQLDLVMAQGDGVEMMNQTLANQPVSMQRVTQLATLAEQFGRSQSAQAAIARSLSSGLLAANGAGRVWFCNPTASQVLGLKVGDLLRPKLIPQWLTPEQWQTTQQALANQQPSKLITVAQAQRWFELRLEPIIDRRHRWAAARGPETPPHQGDFLLLLEEVTQSKQAELELIRLNQKLRERSTQLELVNKELESFSYAVSHDLRAPLRRIDGFSHMLLEENATQLDAAGTTYLNRIRASVQHMGRLIEDLLNLSRIIRTEMSYSVVDLSAMVAAMADELQQTQPDRAAEFVIVPNVQVKADANLLQIALENLLNNAWKYTSKKPHTRIEFGLLPHPASDREAPIFFVRDNGAGFDHTQTDRLFGAFQRLHTPEEFPGNGVGLMTTQRIIHRHHGRIWAEGMIDQGATFYFTLQLTAQAAGF
jgi:CHASE2 domain-containing sensor protein/signal transduction histidine kinase